MKIRTAVFEDCRIVTLMAQIMQEESPAYRRYEFDKEKLRKWFGICCLDADWQCLIAETDKGEPAGFMAYGCQEMLFSTAKTVDDLALYVLPKFRGTLAGPKMVKRCLEWAKAKGAAEVRLGITTEIDNSRVEKFLHVMGFETSGLLCRQKL